MGACGQVDSVKRVLIWVFKGAARLLSLVYFSLCLVNIVVSTLDVKKALPTKQTAVLDLAIAAFVVVMLKWRT